MPIGGLTPLERFASNLSRARNAAARIDLPLQLLGPGPIDTASSVHLRTVRNGVDQAAEAVNTLRSSGRSLQQSGTLPERALQLIGAFDDLDGELRFLRGYLSGVADAGVIPGRDSETMWSQLPLVSWQVQSVTRSLLDVLAGASRPAGIGRIL